MDIKQYNEICANIRKYEGRTVIYQRLNPETKTLDNRVGKIYDLGRGFYGGLLLISDCADYTIIARRPGVVDLVD